MAAMTALPNFAAGSRIVDWGVGCRALRGESESGDLHVLASFTNGILIGAVDGLGHGTEAAAAARIAGEVLQTHAREPVIQLVRRCHEALRKTRGVVLSIGSIDAEARTLTWIGIGNVGGIIFYADRTTQPARQTVLTRGGVVGYQLPPLKETVLPIAPGDTVIFATDGIRGNFSDETPLGRSPQEVADDILGRFANETDDALVLVARYLGVSR
jgi:negative regulator of sigma-B (phosphoserine phosphatase)